MKTQSDTITDERLDTGDGDDHLAHLFCKGQASSDFGTIARCGKRKDQWVTASAAHPTCIVCVTMMQSGVCVHCGGTA